VAGVSHRILVLTPFAPMRGGRHGGVRVIHGLLSALAERHELILLHLDREHAVDPALAARCLVVRAAPAAPLGDWSRRALALAATVQRRSLWSLELGLREARRSLRVLVAEFEPDVVQVEYGVIAEALSGAGRAALRIATIHDPAASQLQFVPLRPQGPALVHRVDAWAARRQEQRVLSLADAAVVFSERDRAALAARAGASRAEVVTVPPGWDVPQRALDPVGVDPPTLLFVGNFMHPPNVDAAARLAQAILPRIRRQHPSVALEIVGESPPPELLALGGGPIRVTGAVPSVTPHLDRAAVVMAPLQLGGGVRVKVLEALAAGKAVVASPLAAEGVGARDGEQLIVADGDEAIAAATSELVGDPTARRALAGRARAWALRELSFAKMAERYGELYDDLHGLRHEPTGGRAR
jgi:polysaccharide biosynthesis protein PslH